MLSEVQADGLFSPLNGAGHLVLAVSGGPDSVALMILAAHWSAVSHVLLSVATVDHGLRDSSAAEAQQVGQWAAALELPHTTLNWTGEKPKTGLQEQARDARYRLLTGYAIKIGASGIVTAHHADDQAETILFRLARGSGLAGLAGMQTKSFRDGIDHWRPFLALAKSDLIAICAARDHRWIDDPSNRNEAFARTGLRRLAGLLEQQGLDRSALLRLGQRAARANEALESQTERFARDWPTHRGAGLFEGDATYLGALPAEFALRLLAREIAAVTGSHEPLRLDRLEKAGEGLLSAIAAATNFKTSLGGALLTLDRLGRLHIAPEPPRRRGR